MTIPAEPPPEVPSWLKAVNEAESARAIKEYEAIQRQAAAKEHEEQQAKERTRLTYEEEDRKELKQREEEEIRASTCVVPSLRGHTLSAARRTLKKAHCRLGKIVRRSHRHGILRVISQSPAPGSRLAAGVSIVIVCRLEPRAASRR
jgi:tyrosyl-tRNA synthetase